tara:strand:- start:784 stop:1167 length:384 start_codon:yes stop_codon:yes gene_type:complete
MSLISTINSISSEDNIINLNKGDILFNSGDKGSSIYAILKGIILLTWKTIANEQKHEEIIQGNVFGTGALITKDHSRFSSAKAIKQTELIELNRDKFLFAVQEVPMFALELLASLDERIQEISLRNI